MATHFAVIMLVFGAIKGFFGIPASVKIIFFVPRKGSFN